MSAAPLRADVVVCGGGVAGTMAAVAAARHGASVVLVERYGFLGGNATAGAVAQFNSWQTAGGRRVIGGLADDVVARLRKYGAAGEHQVFVMSTGHKMDRVEYAPEVLKLVFDDMLVEAGVKPLLHASILDVQCDAAQGAAGDAADGTVAAPRRRIQSVRALTKSGIVDLHPQVLIDASGDIDALKHAGAQFLALEAGEALQPATMMFRFGPVDFAQFDGAPREQIAALAKRGFAEGRLARAALHASRDPYSSDAWFNISRLAVDATDAFALGAAEMEGRRQAWSAAQFLHDEVPGCAAGRLRAFGTQAGVRETRRIAGDHVLTADELRRPEQFADAIAAGAYPIDIHPVAGGGLQYEAMSDDHAYQIPYRSLIPVSFTNALVAGRGVSATHEALAAIRVMPISMAVGQAAGTAAALALKPGGGGAGGVRSVPVDELRAALLRDGACLR